MNQKSSLMKTPQGVPGALMSDSDIYLHAATRNGPLPGRDARLCIQNGSAFKINGSDKACRGAKRKKVGMTKFVVRSGNNTWNFR